MKSHRTKEQRFDLSKLPENMRDAFYAGWYAAGSEINEGEDSDWLQERLYAEDFLPDDIHVNEELILPAHTFLTHKATKSNEPRLYYPICKQVQQ